MAERRMFAKSIIDSDAFLEMPLSTQALYFHLSMRADDDGFVNNPKKIAKMLGAGDDEFKVLLAKKFLIGFESGVIVIKHWKIHNYIQKDRYTPTKYFEEKNYLSLNENKAYSLVNSTKNQICIQDVYSLDTQVRLGKDRLEIGKDSLEKETSSVENIENQKNDDDDFFKKFFFEISSIKNYPANEEIDRQLLNQINEFQNDEEKILKFVRSWNVLFLQNPEKPRERLLGWIKSNSKEDIKVQNAALKKAQEDEQKKIAAEKAKKAEEEFNEKIKNIKSPEDACVFIKQIFSNPPTFFKTLPPYIKDIMSNFGLTKEKVWG